VGIAALLVILHSFPPGASGFYPVCGTYAFLGIHCPGCGSLRALHHLTHGRWLAALNANALLVMGLGAGGVWAFACRARYGTWSAALDRLQPAWIWWGGATVLAFGVLRNLPWEPFTRLAP
jgi:hypothetical protein